MIVRDHPALSLSRQCRLLALGRSSLYYEPKGESAGTLAMSLSLLKFVGQASLVDDAMLPS